MKTYTGLEITQLGGDMNKRRFIMVPSDPHVTDAIHSARHLLDDAKAADAETDHDQRENWRLSHATTVAAFFGIE